MGTGATASESSGSVADYTDDDGVADTDGQTEPDLGDLTVYENTIAGNEQGIDATGGQGTLSAPENYWDADTGPGGDGPGDGDPVSENVDFEPWLDEDGRTVTP